MKSHRLSRPAVQLIAACALVASPLCNFAPTLRAQTPANLAAPAASTSPSPAPAHEEAIPLERYVVAATRSAQSLDTLPSSLTALDLPQLELSQINQLADALAATPGVILVNSGATGGQSSLFTRGSSSHQTLFIVDGLRMNDRSASYANFLGGADLAGVGRLEILRGAQSTLYGSSAMGGVIVLDTTRGCGKPQGKIGLTAGSLDTFGTGFALSGGKNTFGYSASFASYQTDNDRAFNAYDQFTSSARLEWQAAPAVLLGVTFRGQQGDYEEPGSLLFPSQGNVDSKNALATVFAEWKPNYALRSRLTLGRHARDYRFATPFFASVLANRRDVLDWQTTWDPPEKIELVAGLNVEKSEYTINTASTDDDQRGAFASAYYRPLAPLTVFAGLRYDDYDSAGSATTWRGGASWLFPATATKLRATYGTGFSAPGSDDRFGVAAFGQLANPAIRPEKSSGWDAGVDQSFFEKRLTLSATYFHNRFRDLFEYEILNFTTFEGRIVNRARASTRGVELAAELRLNATLNTSLSYTYLDARNDLTGARLTRRPRHTINADVSWSATRAWTLGAGLRLVSGRIEGTSALEAYNTVRVYTSYAVNPRLTLKLRAENVFDKTYEEVRGYPALPARVIGNVEWSF